MKRCVIAFAFSLAALFGRGQELDNLDTRNYDDEPALVLATPEERIKAVRALKRVEKRSKRLGFVLNRGKMEKLKGERLFKILAEYDRVVGIIERLPENFVKACAIGSIWFSDDIVDASGNAAGGTASGEGINLSMGSDAGTIYHEMFHKFERCISDSQCHEWEEINPEDFIYEGSQWDAFGGNDRQSRKQMERYRKRVAAGKEKTAQEKWEESLSKKDKAKIDANRNNPAMQAAFVNRYAQTTPKEDRAEVFRAMMCEGPQFLQRVRASEYMRAKMEFMIRLTGTNKYLGDGFWQQRVEVSRLDEENADPYGPIDTANWRRISPEDAGFDAKRLNAIPRLIEKRNMGTTGLVIIVGGKLMYEWGDVSTPSDISLCWPSLLSILYGKRVADGRIALDATLSSLGITDEGGLLPREAKATVRDLISSRSGCYHPSADGVAASAMPSRGSRIAGSEFVYNTWDFNAAAAVFERAAGKNVIAAMTEDLAEVLQFQDWNEAMQKRTGNILVSSHLGYTISLSARDMARVGEMMLRGGVWKGLRIVPNDWVRESTASVTKFKSGGGFGYMWWIEDESADPIYKGAFSARGLYGQRITVLPELDMVVVHISADGISRPTRGDDYRRLIKLIALSRSLKV